MPDILLHLLLPILASLLYGTLGFHFWHTRWREIPAPLPSPPPPRAMQLWERSAIALALTLQGIDLYADLFGHGSMRFSFSLALSSMMWLAVLIYWLESFNSRMEGLQPLVLPLASLCSALPLFFPQVHLIMHADALAFRMHFLAAMSAYSLFTLSALHAVFMAIVEKKLHRRVLNRYLSSLPPLLTMEALLFRMIIIAFALLTVALASGIFFAESFFGKRPVLDHKTLFAFTSWGIFAALLVGRRMYGWRGRIALRWTMTGFLCLLLAYVGSRFVSEVVLGRI